MDKGSEIKGLETSWKLLDDPAIIRDVLYKGKYISNALRFIAERRLITIEQSKEMFAEICDELVNTQIQMKQPSRACHILRNVQINELHYLFDVYVESKDDDIKEMLYEYLVRLNDNFKEEETNLRAYHACFKLLMKNIENHRKCLDNVNRIHNSFNINSHNIQKATFPRFMLQSIQWRNDLSVDVFFKSRGDERNSELLPILDKNCFFVYIIQNELSGVIKQWINEQYFLKTGKPTSSTLITDEQAFDDALNDLFRKWTFEEHMMNQISKRHKDVLKNEFARIGLFEARESKQLWKKFNRFFTTCTFQENYPTLKSHEVTKFIVDNKLVDLLPYQFIDHDYIQKVIKEKDEKDDTIHDELVLIGSMKDLLTKQINLQSFVDIMNVTSSYIQKNDTSFNANQPELRFMNEIVSNNIERLDQIADINPFLRNLFIKLTTKEDLPSIEELLETFHSIKLDYIRDEFGSDSAPSFDNPNLVKAYGQKIKLNYLDYIKMYRGTYASYVFIIDSIKESKILTRSMILDACEEVAKLALNDPTNEDLVSHAVAFIEIFSVDTRNLRCFIQLQKLKCDNQEDNAEKFLDKTIKMSTKTEDIKNVESLEIFWKVKMFSAPRRSYLNPYLEKDDWFNVILFAQYFNYSIRDFISVCQHRIKNKTLSDNLIRAISYEVQPLPEPKPSDPSDPANKKPDRAKELFGSGQFLDSKDDLFAILLKCDENVNRLDFPFEDFQRFFTKDEPSNDLLYYAKRYDWPLLAVLAGTTKMYKIKYCWLTWVILSSNYKWTEKFEDVKDITISVFEHCLRIGFLRTLDESFFIFYEGKAMLTFMKFLRETANGNFKDMDMVLSLFVDSYELNDQNIDKKHRMILCIIRYLIIHLQHNIKFSVQQQEYLACLHRSKVAKYDSKVNFELMRNLCKILEHTNVEMNYEVFNESETKVSKEIDRICDELINNNYFEAAIEIGNLMNKSKTEFVFKYWLHLRKFDNQNQASFDISKYLKYVKMYRINIDVFIKFLKRVIDEMDQSIEKYNLMIYVLKNMPKADSKRNDLEYEVILLYLRLKISGINDIKPLTSEYYENDIKPKRSLIHDSLFELKAIAMIDDLNDTQCLTDDTEIQQLKELMSFLLDINDIVQVLRLQAMFGYAPEDLKILVYMLSVAEGVTSIYDITRRERQEISKFRPPSTRLNRIGFKSSRQSTSNSMDSSSVSMEMNESSILQESIHYKENKETLQALQGLVCKLNHGVKHAQRVVLLYRISLFLQNQSFEELIKIKNAYDFLELVTESDCDNKLLAMSDIIEAMEMSKKEVAKFISKEITACIIKTRFQQFNKDTEVSSSNLNMNASFSSTWSGSKQVLDDIWGFSLSKDLHLILELCKGKTALLGTYLIKCYRILSQFKSDIPINYESFEEELKSICEDINRSLTPQMLSLKKQNIIRVELLIIAHDCFSQECSTEGIGDVLHLSKMLINELAEKKVYSLIVKLMCGIGRYREMIYCFDILIKNEAFEELLGQFNDKQTNGLKNALLSYLNEYHPDNKEYFKMCASHFLMYTELAKIWKNNAMTKIKKLLKENQVILTKSGRIFTKQVQQVEVPYLKCSKNVLQVLNEAIKDMIYATEMMTVDQKIEISLKYSSLCELYAMQYHLVKVGIESELKICPCVIYQEQNFGKPQLIAQYLANHELLVPQMMILNKNVSTPIDFTMVLFCRSIMTENEQYLHDFIGRLDLTDRMIEKVIKLTHSEKITDKQEKILQDLCLMVRDVGVKYYLASLFGCKNFLSRLLNDEQSYHYLIDSDYGNKDIYGTGKKKSSPNTG